MRVLRKKDVKELADELLVSPSYVNAIENGKKEPSVRLFRDYANALGLKQETLKRLVNNSKHMSIEKIIYLLLKESFGEEELESK